MDIIKEKIHLAKTIETIKENMVFYQSKAEEFEDMHKKSRAFVWENTNEIDEYEQSGLETIAQLNQELLINAMLKRNLMERVMNSPYWGRVNFTPEGLPNEDIYIGLTSIYDEQRNLIVIDWRAPISSIYYNFELGEAQYESPVGTQKGYVHFKYQYKIENGELKYVLDTSTTITDEILMRELSKNASHIMKNIAATIQKEQNEIIRLPFGQNLLVQGVAGSGKTSVALHRIAYLLYNKRDFIKPKDILIISPNKAFSAYISHVLPELGEDNVMQLCVEDIARTELSEVAQIQSRLDYLDDIYNNGAPSKEIEEDMRYKASFQFVTDIDEALDKFEKMVFKGRDFLHKDLFIGKQVFNDLFFVRFKGLPWFERLNKIVEYVEVQYADHFKVKVSPDTHYRVFKAMRTMFKHYDNLDIYCYLLQHLKNKNVIVPQKDQVVPFRDVYGLLYVCMKNDGLTGKYGKYKQVTIDEMQDYFPIQYAVIDYLFKCPKTILGDLNQIVDPYMNAGTLENMRQIIGEHQFRKMSTSYRSSKEITLFANRFVDEKVTPVDRLEERPRIIKCDSFDDEIERIKNEIEISQKEKGYQSIAIIARNKEQAAAISQKLGDKAFLLTSGEKFFAAKVIVTTALIVKGFEFDQVIIADVDQNNYSTENEKRILYVAVTRALHSVVLLHRGEPSVFLDDPKE